MPITVSPSGGGGGGSSSPQLPVWTFQSSDSATPNDGFFTTDNAVPFSTTLINFAGTIKQGGAKTVASTLFGTGNIGLYCKIILTSLTTGKVLTVEWGSATNLGDPSQGEGVMVEDNSDSGEAAWAGDYAVSLAPNNATVTNDSPVFTGNPTAPTQPALDTSTKLATTAYTDNAVAAGIAALLVNPTALASFISSAGITPFTGSVTPVTEVDANTGIVTGAS